MVRTERQGSTRRRGVPGWPPSGSRRYFWLLAGMIVLVVMLVASVAGCSSDTQASSNTTAASASSAQTGTQTGSQTGTQTGSSAPTGMPGTPPTDANGQAMTPPSGGNRAGSSTTTTAETTTTTSASTTTTEAPTTTTSLKSGQYGDGIHRIGYSYDIDPGLYKGTVVGDKGSWEISTDADGVKFVANGTPTGPFYVKVTSGQYLNLRGVIIQEASSTAADPLATKDITDGTYRVGYDIATGWYNGTVNGTMGYWEISSDANGTTLVANDYAMGSFTLKVVKGQYLTLRGVTVSK
jgi:hypothetical protein